MSKKQTMKILCVASALFLSAAAASAANIVLDGDFEGGFVGFTPPWTVTSSTNNIGVSTAFSADTPQAGSFFAFFGDGIPITNHLDQTLTTIIGDEYSISFYLAVQPDSVSDGSFFGSHSLAPSMAVGWTGSSFTTYNFPASEAFTQAYTQYTLFHFATTTSTNLEFAGSDDYKSAILLDTVVVTDLGAIP